MFNAGVQVPVMPFSEVVGSAASVCTRTDRCYRSKGRGNVWINGNS